MVVLLTALFAGLPSPALAATAPVLTALSVSSTTVTPPGVVRLSYAATSQTSTLGRVQAWYRSPVSSRGDVFLEATNAPLTGAIAWQLPDGLRNVTYTLYEVTVVSPDFTAFTAYSRDGTTSQRGTHAFDFPSMDVTVVGSHEDTRGPALTSVSVTPDVKPGQPVSVAWSGDEPSGVASATFSFAGVGRPSGFIVSSTSPQELSARRITRTLTDTVFNERHVIDLVRLEDKLGNETTWYPDGRVTNVPHDAGPEDGTHTLPLSSTGFSVTGSTYDPDPPVLKSFAVDRQTARAGDAVKVTYAASDATLPLDHLTLRYARPGTETSIFDLWASDLPSTGSFTTRLPSDFVGDAELVSVEVADRKGNYARYLADGTVERGPVGTTGRHSWDFSRFPMRVMPSALSAAARSRPRAAALRWSLPSGQARYLTGYRITVNPGGRVLTLPSNGKDYQQTIVTGLTNATKYTFTVTSQSRVGPGPTSTLTATPLLSGNIWAAGDVNRDRRNDLFAMVQPPANGIVKLYRGTGKPGLGTVSNVADWSGYRPHPADTVFGSPTHFAVDWAGGLEAVFITRSGGSEGSVEISKGWGGMRFIDGSADFTGDKLADIVAVTPTGVANLYRGRSGGWSFAKGTRIGGGWDTMQAVFAASDVTGDRRADLLAVDAAGRLRIYPGNGRGGFGASRVVGPGWGAFGAVFSGRDLTGDGRVDLGAVTMSGDLYVYKGNGRGGFPTHTKIGHGWHNFF